MENEEDYFTQYGSILPTVNDIEYMNNLEYNPNGELFSYSTDSSLKIYSSANGNIRNIITADIGTMKYFQNNTILHSKDNSIFYLSIFDNKYLRKFDKHTDEIQSISVNPIHDTFMSVGSDNINLWDIRYQPPVYSIKSTGKIGAISRGYQYALADSNFLHIFDWRNTKGPLIVKNIKPNYYEKIFYTADESHICLTTMNNHVFLNSMGEMVSSLSFENPCDGDVSPESNIFICGSSSLLLSYKISDKKMVGRTNMSNFECKTVRCNPVNPQFICSSGSSLRIYDWIKTVADTNINDI